MTCDKPPPGGVRIHKSGVLQQLSNVNKHEDRALIQLWNTSVKRITLKALLLKSDGAGERQKGETEIGRQIQTEQRKNKKTHPRRGSEGMKPESETQHGCI